MKKSFVYFYTTLLFLSLLTACDQTEEKFDKSDKHIEDEITVKTSQGDEYVVGFIHHDKFYSVNEDQVRDYFISTSQGNAHFTDINLKMNENQEQAMLCSKTAKPNDVNKFVSIAVQLDFDNENQRLLMHTSTCQCVSSNCEDHEKKCVVVNTGGCQCNPCPDSECEKISTATTSRDLFLFFVGND